MPYTVTDDRAGVQGIYVVETEKKLDLGTTITVTDPVTGGGELVYLKASIAIAEGEAVIFDALAGTIAKAVNASRGLIAIALNTMAINTFGWFQVYGVAKVKSATAVAGSLVYASATAGTIDDAVSATNKIDGAKYLTNDGVPSAGFAYVQISDPALNGNG